MDRRLTVTDLARRLGSWTPSDVVLYQALARSIERLIRAGEIAPGIALPAERRLAQQLMVSRGTVMAAYEVLRRDRLVATVHGSGTVVLHEGSPVTGPREAHLAASLPHDSLLDYRASDGVGRIDLRAASWVVADQVAAIPAEQLRSRLMQAATADRFDTLGAPGLRTAIADGLTEAGLPTRPDQLLITSGAQQAISLTAQLYVGSGDHVIAEDPTYPGAIEVMVAQQAHIERVPVGPAGVDLPTLRAAVESSDPRLVYLVPSVHNPTGTVMPAAARQRLAELLATWSTVIVDDTTLMETQLDGKRPAPLAAFADEATARRIVTVGSLSKVVWDGLRIGWIRADEPTITRLSRLKCIADLRAPALTQALAEELLVGQQTLYAARRTELRQWRAAMQDLLAEHLPNWRWLEPQGGFCLWIDTGAADGRGFCEMADRHGVTLLPPEISSATARFPGHLRIPYVLPPEVLREAVLRLAAAWRAYTGGGAEPQEPASSVRAFR